MVKTSDEVMGTGGCIAYALAKLDVLGSDQETVSAKLNAQIDTVQRLENIERDIAGKEDDFWHPECIRKALEAECGRGNYIFRKLHPREFVRFINDHHGQSMPLLVDGILNASWVCSDTMERSRHDDTPGQGRFDHLWRHAVSVRSKRGRRRVYCKALGEDGANVRTLWLDDADDMHIQMGYMQKLLKVYVVAMYNPNRTPVHQ
jgi:hypothetical protein